MNIGNKNNRVKTLCVQDGGHVDMVRHGGIGDLCMIMPVLEALATRLDITFHCDAKWEELFTLFKHSFSVNTRVRNLRTPYFNLNGVIDYLPYCAQKHRIDLFADEVRRYLLDDFEITKSYPPFRLRLAMSHGRRIGSVCLI